MGVSYRPIDATVVRTGEQRATLVRRTYLLVLASVLVTMAGTAFALESAGRPAGGCGPPDHHLHLHVRAVVRRAAFP